MKSIFETITWPQVALVGILLAFAFAAHVYMGPSAGAALGFVTTLVAFLSGRNVPPAGGAS